MAAKAGMPALAAPIGALLVAMISVQVGASVAKGLFHVVGPLGATTLRVGFAALMLLAIWRPWRAPFLSWSRWPILVYGVVLGVMTMLFYQALARIPLGVAVALEFTGPLAVATLASRRLADFLWVGFAVAGLLLLLPLGPLSSKLDLVGVAFALGAGVFWALYIVFGKLAGAGGGGQAVGFGMAIAAVVVAPFGIVGSGQALFSVSILPLALLIALLTSVIPYSLEMIALTRLPAKTFGILMSAEPALGVLAGFVILKERLSGSQGLAVALIIVASAGAVFTRGPAKPVSQTDIAG